MRRRKANLPKGLLTVAVVAAALSSPLACVAGIALIGASAPDDEASPEVAAATGIPERVLVAYQRAGNRCQGLDWTLLAAIGAVETRHGQVGGATVNPSTGEARPWIFGPLLDGRNGTLAIPIGRWIGWWGLPGPWTQAVGPMQFLPTTFEQHAVDADNDGTTNPHDIDDATATTANHLCTASEGAIDGPDEAARIYNPGDPSYATHLAEEQRRIDKAARSTGLAAPSSAVVCPVAGPVQFTDTFGAPRSGGRTHQGVDIFAPTGTPVVAPANGRVEHYHNDLGGLSYRLYADDGTYYYGTHLTAYESTNAGNVTAGTTIGYVGNTGNAATTPPHLHWEIHPDGRDAPAINPTPTAGGLCRR